MILERLLLQNYRNIGELHLDLHPRLTILVGDNGAGKTNILEAIHLLALPRSFRGSKEGMLVRWGESFARVEGSVSNAAADDTTQLTFFYQRSKKLMVNNSPKTGADFVGTMLAVLFAPEDISLLSGSPSFRRSFIDAYLSQLSRSYFINLLHYQKVLKQRNKLLSSRGVTIDELEYWNSQLLFFGSSIMAARFEFFSSIQSHLPDNLHINYKPSFESNPQNLLDLFQDKQGKILQRELIVGHSLIGPHRDDWTLVESGQTERDLGLYGSRGEQRMAIILLKRIQLSMMSERVGEKAILLLDDVLSELDAVNQQQLVESLNDQQTIITTASLSDIAEDLLKDAFVYEVTEGMVTRL